MLLEAIILGDGGLRHTDIICLLVKVGTDINWADSDGVTPLGHDRRRGFEDIINVLEGSGY